MNNVDFLKALHYAPMSLTPESWYQKTPTYISPIKLYNTDYYELPYIDTSPIHNDLIYPLQFLSEFFQIAYGLYSLNWQQLDKPVSNNQNIIKYFRRTIPSGGALYPNELYCYLENCPGIKNGIYHYNVSKHHLMLIQNGKKVLPDYSGKSIDCSKITFFISIIYWRNLYKYGYFSYRLLPQDTGVLLGQMSLLLNKYNLNHRITNNINDLDYDKLLKLNPLQENILSVISVELDRNAMINEKIRLKKANKNTTNSTDIKYSNKDIKNLGDYCHMMKVSMPKRLYKYCLNKRYPCRQFNKCIHLSTENANNINIKHMTKRCSPGNRFFNQEISNQAFVDILCLSIQFFQQEIPLYDDNTKQAIHVYVTVKNVSGIPAGTYYFDHTVNQLQLITSGNEMRKLGRCLTRHNVNCQAAAFCVHVVADNELLFDSAKSYRICLISAGILYQIFSYQATLVSCGAHILMSFDAKKVGDLYQIDTKKFTVLSQIVIGPFQSIPRLQGKLFNFMEKDVDDD